ncbi:hypothetical protein Bca101_043160 [Brassica carinata]
MSSQLEPVAELETLKTHVDHSGSPSLSTIGHRHQSGEASKLSPNGSPRKEDELQGEHSHHKKSLFSKMKDKAKKLQHSLSGKSRHEEEEGDATLSPFRRFSDHQVREAGGYATLSPRDKSSTDRKVREEGDPEYLGAPMYESKKAPEELKENARQHPRETPVITETNLLSVLPAKDDADTTTTVTKSMSEKTGKEHMYQESSSPSKTVTETVTETLAPAYAKVSDATHAITKKIQDMALPESTDAEPGVNDVSEINTAGTNTKLGAKNMVPASNSGDNKTPILANKNEIVEEENHGKILQSN